jgi:transposase-like protein
LHAERDLEADRTTLWPWLQRYGPELEQRLCRRCRHRLKRFLLATRLLKSRGIEVRSAYVAERLRESIYLIVMRRGG